VAKQVKVCPILQAGAMMTVISTHTGSYPVAGEVKLHAFFRHLDTGCIKKSCEWYMKGCPAHPAK